MKSTQCKEQTIYVGADISKDSIDISWHSGVQRITKKITNTDRAIKTFVKSMKVEKGAVLHFIFEATGYYSKTLYTTLRDCKIRFTELNPRCSWAFNLSMNVLNKTDKVDAMVLEEYGRRMNPVATIPDEDLQIELKNLYMLRVSLIEAQKKWRQRIHQYKTGTGHKITERMIKFIDNEIEPLDKKIMELINNQKRLKVLYKAFTNINGVGYCGAAAVLCLMPEIGMLHCNQICKLAGLAPMKRQSGTSINKTSHISGGRKHLRTGLYMPTVSATIHNPIIRAYYKRMLAKIVTVKPDDKENTTDKKGKWAIVPCMRKLLKHMNSVARREIEKMQRNVAAEGGGEAA